VQQTVKWLPKPHQALARLGHPRTQPLVKLPSARLLSQEYDVAIGTVKRAVEPLRAEALVHTVSGGGIFVTRLGGRGPAGQREEGKTNDH
jgi:DNA-binding GntR family transcriptional regulator